MPSIVDLSVIPSGTGVSARCEFEGYEADSGYSMNLYLNQVKEDGEVTGITLKGVFPPPDGCGVEITGGEAVEPGIYRATLVFDRMDGGPLQVDRFKNSPWYDVARSGDGYVVTLHRDQENADPEVGNESDAPEHFSCDHSQAIWQVEKEADPDRDAILAGVCTRCGEVLSYSFVPNSAYAAFLADAIYSIQNASAGEAFIETERWISFNQEVFDAIEAQPEVAVTVRYRYEGRHYEVTIPAGADVRGLTDENGFCGFRYLDHVFGGKEIVD